MRRTPWPCAPLALAALACGAPRGGAGFGDDHAQALTSEPGAGGRLGDVVQPRRAELDLTIDPRQAEYRGRVTIEVQVARPVHTLWLHARGLTIDRAELLVDETAVALQPLAASRTPPELLGLEAPHEIPSGTARVQIDYRGRMGDEHSLFRQQSGGAWYAFTDFEPTDARGAVPCFDEPRFKIPWRVTLRVPAGMEAFSNSAPERDEVDGTTRRVVFRWTRPLPSYLLAFAAGPFEVVAAAAAPVPVRVIALKGRGAHARTALEMAPALLTLLEKYMGARTPYPKVDFIAVPEFNGAMENPGLITVAASILLQDPALVDSTSEHGRDRRLLLLTVLAHEVAHLWFGDVVTMIDWPELWLNEGLATWMSDHLASAYDPTLAGAVLDLADKSSAARLDRQERPRIVRQAIRRAEDLGEAFGPMTYRKGGALVSMAAAYLGPARFQAALRRYVGKHADGVVSTRDLAGALSHDGGSDLEPVLEGFLDQPGIPLVDLALECAPGKKPSVSLRQERYAPVGRPRAARTWRVPLCVSFDGGGAPVCTILDQPEGRLELDAPGCPAWIHPDPDDAGYFYWSLPKEQLAALLRRGHLTQRQSVGLVESLDASLRAGHATVGTALEALVMLATGSDRVVAVRVMDTWRTISRAVVGPAERRRFASLVMVHARLARAVGLATDAGDGLATRELRLELLPLVAREGGESELPKAALDWLDGYVRGAPGIAAPSRVELAALYALAPLAGGAALYKRLVDAAHGRASIAVAGFREPELVKRTLADVASGALSPPDALILLATMLADPVIHEQVLPVALSEFARLAGRLADTDRAFSGRVFISVCRAESRDAVASALRAGLAPNGSLPGDALAVLEQIDECVAFRRHHQAAAAAYLK